MSSVFYCLLCINYEKDQKCRAFEKIPDEIFYGKMEHESPLLKQGNKFVFEPIIKNTN